VLLSIIILDSEETFEEADHKMQAQAINQIHRRTCPRKLAFTAGLCQPGSTRSDQVWVYQRCTKKFAQKWGSPVACCANAILLSNLFRASLRWSQESQEPPTNRMIICIKLHFQFIHSLPFSMSSLLYCLPFASSPSTPNWNERFTGQLNDNRIVKNSGGIR